MNFTENIKLAVDSIRSSKLRTFLTLLSVSIGVFAIIGAGSLVDSINGTVSRQLEDLGETVYYVTRTPMIQMGPGQWRKYMARKRLTYRIYEELKENSHIPKEFSCYTEESGITIKYKEDKTDPNFMMFATTAGWIEMMNYHPAVGRAFTDMEVQQGSRVAVVGNDVVQQLMNGDPNPIGKTIKVNDHKFTIIGVTEPKGAMMGQSADNYVVVPMTWYLNYYARRGKNTDLSYCIKAPSKELLDASMDETIGILRSIRNCKPWEANSFEISDNSSITEMFGNITQYLGFFGAACGAIALLAAGVGIMNIMLVSVKERTREIGIRKAVGAKSISILAQFLIEAVTLCWLGASIGIVLGVLVGGAFGALVGMPLGIPYSWIIISIVICSALGMVSGAYPAWKAAKLDPIEALRYE
jgi:putative ABC transport system permease protein